MEIRKSPSWEDLCFKRAYEAATRSNCSDNKVGVVLLDNTNRFIAHAGSGPEDGSCGSWCKSKKEMSLGCPSLHAEEKALITVDSWNALEGYMYITAVPCTDCADMMITAKLTKVHFVSEWDEDYQAIAKYLSDNGITVYVRSRLTQKEITTYYG